MDQPGQKVFRVHFDFVQNSKSLHKRAPITLKLDKTCRARPPEGKAIDRNRMKVEFESVMSKNVIAIVITFSQMCKI